ncbi:aminotransferase [Pseudoclavibacter helvolus]|uniref:4-aminobutyrate aminotransferase-like enzyme/Ser/Thr protein kinase RdoA (MazF antagonist) n=1 Tax=Pseudoclavibacter helvolus TaxID=255205 RepID=A0A7W4YFX6_9MICO|nr:aminotransferase [Pseudoclavibacter helvolus]MBB2959029.1 4-aminobutyrate aminotransferase-like enzyme/Ser/Thr protein kinase RdoA (MazF antagonist) [Pseudoclavibacter helvolus]
MAEFSEGLPRPNVTVDEVRRLASELYGVSGEVRELGSQQDRNFLFTEPSSASEPDGRRVLFKISNRAVRRDEIEAQNEAMQRMHAAGHPSPAPIPSVNGREIEAAEVDGAPHSIRLLTFVEGTPLIDFEHFSAETIAAMGTLVGQVVATLGDFEHPGLNRELQWDLRVGERLVEELINYVADPERRALVLGALEDATAVLAPLKDSLPLQAIHGDLTDDNLVATAGELGRPQLSGIIDFGDVGTGWRIAELAVACTAVFHHDPARPLAVLPLIRAFDEVVHLTDAEVDALWSLIVLRGATLVVSGLQQVAIDEGNDYAEEALEREWTIFAVPAGLDSRVATAAIRRALGRNVVPGPGPGSASGGVTMLDAQLARSARVVTLDYTSTSLRDGSWLGEEGAEAEAQLLLLAARSSGVAATRFGEPRLTRSVGVTHDAPVNVATGVELYSTGDLALVAPFDGLVSAADGHVTISDGARTIVVAGARGLIEGRSLEGESPEESTRVQAGEPFCEIAGWAQVTLQLGEVSALDAAAAPVPRFVTTEEFPAWLAVIGDPSELVGLTPSDVRAGGAEETLRARLDAYAPLQGHYYAHPPQIERGWREMLIDTDGRHYLDMVNNVTALGHGHPVLADAVAQQWRMLNTNSRFNYASVAELGQRLLDTLPDTFDTVLLVNSGTEAVDLALRLTKAFTGRDDVACVEESYHGWSYAADAVSTSTSDNPLAAERRAPWVHAFDAPNAYRGTHRGDRAGELFAADAIAELDRLAAAGTPVGTFIAEPRNGNAGAIEVPAGYLPAVYDAVRAGGGVVISDEVQVGYGRQGDVFWGFEQHAGPDGEAIVPDVVTVAKAMGNGHPLGAVITRAEIAQALADQGTFFSSAGGSTLSAKLGVTVLDIMRDDRLQENAREVGGHLREQLLALAERQPLIGAIHGRGLYQGIELVRDRETLEPAAAETRALCDRMLALGIVVQPTGDRGNVLKVKPPLCFTKESADTFVAALDEVLTRGL